MNYYKYNRLIMLSLLLPLLITKIKAAPIEPISIDKTSQENLRKGHNILLDLLIDHDTLYTIQGEMLLGKISYEKNRIKLLDSNGEISTFRSDQVHKIHFANGKQKQFSPLPEEDSLHMTNGDIISGMVEENGAEISLKYRNGYTYSYESSKVHKIRFRDGTEKLFNPLNDDAPSEEEKIEEEKKEKKTIAMVLGVSVVFIIIALLLGVLLIYALFRYIIWSLENG